MCSQCHTTCNAILCGATVSMQTQTSVKGVVGLGPCILGAGTSERACAFVFSAMVYGIRTSWNTEPHGKVAGYVHLPCL